MSRTPSSVLGFLLGLGLLSATGGICRGQGTVHRFELESQTVGAEYLIEVVSPAAATAGDSTWPAVYCTDWFVIGNYLQALPRLMDMGRLTEPFVLVGISQGGDTHDWAVARTRDFTPARPTDAYSLHNIYSPAVDLAGGGSRFIAFLAGELIPYVESNFPVDPSRRGFVGYSLGGLLGVQILTQDPQLFDRYLLGSPSMWFNDYSLASAFEELPAERLAPIAKVYLSVGENESWEMLKGFGMIRDTLRRGGFAPTRAKMEIIGDAGHVGAMPISLYNGVRFLFARE